MKPKVLLSRLLIRECPPVQCSDYVEVPRGTEARSLAVSTARKFSSCKKCCFLVTLFLLTSSLHLISDMYYDTVFQVKFMDVFNKIKIY